MSQEFEIQFQGIDFHNRPIFIDKFKNFYGSTDILFADWEVPRGEKLQKALNNLTFFGRSFGCEPMGDKIKGTFKLVDKIEFVKIKKG